MGHFQTSLADPDLCHRHINLCISYAYPSSPSLTSISQPSPVAMIIRSSAYSSSHGQPKVTSLYKASSMMIKRRG